jgi:hypothetical protein
MNMKKSLFLGLSFLLISNSGLSGCSANNPNVTPADSFKSATAGSLKSAATIIDIGKGRKGANLTFKLNLRDFKNFNIKSSAGTAPKTSANIDHFVAYLIKNAAGTYPTTGDPIGEAVIGYEDGFSITSDSTMVTFTNVPDSSGMFYYVAVRAVDSLGADIIDQNNHDTPSGAAWAGTAFSDFSSRVAVSSGTGAAVDASFAVTDNTAAAFTGDLPVTVNLADAIGATLTSLLTINNGTDAAQSDITIQ